jgi:quercetin dioxygenase-like cupin family protein
MSTNSGVRVSNLRDNTRHITTHDPTTGKAVVHSSTPGNWTSFDNDKLGFNVIYTTSKFPPSLNDDEDIKTHERTIGSGKLGLVNQGGTVCRTVDFAPEYQCMMHRTQSLDYGIVVQGTAEMILDSGETRIMHAGDVAIQRATMHAWRNPSKTEWTRMVFVLQDCEVVKLGDKELGEDLGVGTEGIPPSSKASL